MYRHKYSFFSHFFLGLSYVAVEVLIGLYTKSSPCVNPHCFRVILASAAMAGRPPAGVPLVPGLPRQVGQHSDNKLNFKLR